ncbi:MAG: zinc metalloprotease [Flammeovirgaceae bacterium]|nr:zinc metalloprotease [Flammeovirgaceae bacterium]
MKKIGSFFCAGSMLFAAACSDSSLVRDDENLLTDVASQRQCAAINVLETQLASDPTLLSRMNGIEDHTKRFIESGAQFRINADGKIEIPVVVNVLYRNSSENISLAQIQSQIDVLNEDFNATNSDVSLTPPLFAGTVADVDIQFVLGAVNRKYSNKRSWRTNDAMKKSSQGGINPTDPSQNLNIWVVNSMGGILGYAQFPGGSSATDGVVIAHNYFGRTGVISAPFDKGRTATHEVGHWMNLRHIWGDATCGNDQVSDTPTHNTANYGCPAAGHKSTCSGTPVEMTMNYMDYTDDACMYMFTQGQKSRMLAVFAPGGARYSFAQ